MQKLHENLDKFQRLSSDKYVEPTAKKIKDNGHYKAFSDTEDLLCYNKDKGIYEMRGEQKIKLELDKIYNKKLKELERLDKHNYHTTRHDRKKTKRKTTFD